MTNREIDFDRDAFAENPARLNNFDTESLAPDKANPPASSKVKLTMLCAAITVLILFGVLMFVVINPKDTRVLHGDKPQNSKATYFLSLLNVDSYYINATASIYNKSDSNSSNSDFNPQVKNIAFTARLLAENHAEIRLTDSDNKRFELPKEFPFPVLEPENPISWENSTGKLYYPETLNDDFTASLRRKSTNEILLSLDYNLTYSKYYLEFTTHLPNGFLYGLGERTGALQLKTGTYTLWNHDAPFISDNGTQGSQTYGYHPMYLIREASGHFSLIFLRITNGMDAIIDSEKKTLTFKIAGGGILDIHVMIGGKDPEELLAKYHTYIRKWNIPPFWSLGWHQCRWGYNKLALVENVLVNYENNSLPLDVIWTDIDYMANYIDFTIDEKRYPIDDFNKMLEKYKKRWIPIIDAGVAITNNTEITNKRLKEYDVGIRYQEGSDDYFVGSVWPGPVYYVDFWHPNSDNYWGEMLEMLYKKVKFSGIWLDMNELSNFCNAVCDTNKTKFPELPYNPGGRPLATKTLDMGAVHHGGFKELDVHNFNGYLEGKATYDYLKTKSPLPFIISRSTAYGAGQFINHWTGDNVANVQFLELSVPTIMAFNLFGIPMTGSDICGFALDATELLCARWHQVGAWYPFARNHHSIEGRNQEPYAYGSNSTVVVTTNIALRFRYAHLRHYYTQFLLKNGTGTIFRPLFLEWPTDDVLFDSEKGYSERQFLVGDSLMVCPSFKAAEVDTYQAYFPAGLWFDYKTGVVIANQAKTGVVRTIESKLNDSSAVYIRGGKIVFAEFSSAKNLNNSDDLGNQFTMTVALNKTSRGDKPFFAQGNIMGTQNVSDEHIYQKCVLESCIIQATAEGNNKEVKVSFNVSQGASIVIDGVKLWGLGLNSSNDMKSFLSTSSAVIADLSVLVNGKATETYAPKVEETGDVSLEGANIQVTDQTVLLFKFSN